MMAAAWRWGREQRQQEWRYQLAVGMRAYGPSRRDIQDLQGSTRSMDLGVPLVFPSVPLSSPSGFSGGQQVGKATGLEQGWGWAGPCNAVSPGTGKTWAT